MPKDSAFRLERSCRFRVNHNLLFVIKGKEIARLANRYFRKCFCHFVNNRLVFFGIVIMDIVNIYPVPAIQFHFSYNLT